MVQSARGGRRSRPRTGRRSPDEAAQVAALLASYSRAMRISLRTLAIRLSRPACEARGRSVADSVTAGRSAFRGTPAAPLPAGPRSAARTRQSAPVPSGRPSSRRRESFARRRRRASRARSAIRATRRVRRLPAARPARSTRERVERVGQRAEVRPAGRLPALAEVAAPAHHVGGHSRSWKRLVVCAMCVGARSRSLTSRRDSSRDADQLCSAHGSGHAAAHGRTP